ncbi:MAG: glutathione S-transferase N-terminal domain-containing protein [Gammaproteobacteria bacterium]|nr:glutathione S-transferase N-terminal domain-containing protein [Gammaproteobacteria bacterium]
MLDLYYWPTPNGHKITLFLEEAEVAYRLIPINIGKGEQFHEQFLKIAPNNRIPALVDHEALTPSGSLALFESGAILLYLAEKFNKFMSVEPSLRWQTLQWLFWQMGGLGPMAGQTHHFVAYAPEKIPYAIDRYVREVGRLYKVLNKHLETSGAYIAGDYSIADMAVYPWIVPYQRQQQDLTQFPALHEWFGRIALRPATARAYAKAEQINPNPQPLDDKAKGILFGQSGKS